ncbi:hypothetical protein PS1M3_03310 [Pseudoalteromonas sp. PS1M3]|nr:hypothetical protein PS1M3_03310 [Pseudoalteromonas sp. PS1M3]
MFISCVDCGAQLLTELNSCPELGVKFTTPITNNADAINIPILKARMI